MMALLLIFTSRHGNWGLQMIISLFFSKSQSQEVVELGFELTLFDSGTNYAKRIHPITLRSPPMDERNAGTVRVGGIEGRGRDRSSNTSKATKPFQTSMCLPESEVFPFFTCHHPAWCLGPRFSDTRSCKASQTLRSRWLCPPLRSLWSPSWLLIVTLLTPHSHHLRSSRVFCASTVPGI